jgi:hypothetical protein
MRRIDDVISTIVQSGVQFKGLDAAKRLPKWQELVEKH